jgi:hypothetical protein
MHKRNISRAKISGEMEVDRIRTEEGLLNTQQKNVLG